MSHPLVTGPYPRPKKFKQYPAPPAGSLLVAQHKRDSFAVLVPPAKPGFWQSMGLGAYCMDRRRSGVYDDVHRAPSNNIMIEFTLQSSYVLELIPGREFAKSRTRPLDSTKSRLRPLDASGTLDINAVEAVRYYSAFADPIRLFRSRLRQRFNLLARSVSDAGELHDRVLQLHGSEEPQPGEIVPPPDGHEALPALHGMRVVLEQFNVIAKPRDFRDSNAA